MLSMCQLPSGKSTHFSETIAAKSGFGTDLIPVARTPENNTLHLGGRRSGHYLLWHLIHPLRGGWVSQGTHCRVFLVPECSVQILWLFGASERSNGISWTGQYGAFFLAKPDGNRGLRTYHCKTAMARREGCQQCACACVQVRPALMKSGITSCH